MPLQSHRYERRSLKRMVQGSTLASAKSPCCGTATVPQPWVAPTFTPPPPPCFSQVSHSSCHWRISDEGTTTRVPPCHRLRLMAAARGQHPPTTLAAAAWHGWAGRSVAASEGRCRAPARLTQLVSRGGLPPRRRGAPAGRRRVARDQRQRHRRLACPDVQGEDAAGAARADVILRRHEEAAQQQR
jgi:hypothetical protein